jgi:dsRNA-specific ribonuclease
MLISTVKNNDKALITSIRNTFGLKDEPYSLIDDDLLLLAFMPICRKRESKIKDKYGVCNHQTLEFIGDKILYGVIADILYTSLKLGTNPGIFTNLTIQLTNNRVLTDLMLDVDACKFLRVGDYNITKGGPKFHNKCADSFEALIGVLFVHFQNEDYNKHIKEWILKYTKIPYILRTELNKINMSNVPVYVINNREKLRNDFLKEYNELAEKYKEINPDEVIDIPDISIDTFSKIGYVVNGDTAMDAIYKLLGWKYETPIIVNGVYQLIGYPYGIRDIIAMGNSYDELITNADKFLFEKGLVRNNIEIKRVFSK